MKSKILFTATAAALLAFSSTGFGQTRSGSTIRSEPGLAPPSTGTSADYAGAAGSTARRADTTDANAATSVGASGATRSAGPDRASGLCDPLTGNERIKCLREQASTGTAGGTGIGTSGPASTGTGSGTR